MNEFQQLIYNRLDKINESNLPKHVKDVANKVAICRTNAMPGRLYSCPNGHFSIFYRESCNSRACPTCQHENKQKWNSNTKDLVLDVPHYHIVFKLPTFCYPYFTKFYKQFIHILFNTSSKAILTILKYSQYKNTTPGFICVLHTHGDELQLHPHLHMILSSVTLDKKNNKIFHLNDTLFNINDFQDFYLTLLKNELFKLYFKYPDIGELFLKQVRNFKEQRIFISQKYDSANHLIDYLTKTIKGSGIILNDLEKEQDYVIFNRNENSNSLKDDEFIRRYLLHVLPQYTKSVRYMGFYSTASRSILQEIKFLIAEERVMLFDDFYDSDYNLKKEHPLEKLEPHKFCPLCNAKMFLAEKVDEFKAPSIFRIKFGKDPPLEDLFKRLVA